MAITIAVASQKGGVGKTTTAVNLAAAFRQHGHRVLLVDLDAQSSATQWLTNAYGHQGKVAGDLLMRRAMAQETVVRVPAGFDLIPSDLRLSSIDIDLMPELNRERRLADGLEDLAQAYEFILIDCPPSLGYASINAFVAADACVLPIDCRAQALEALPHLLQSLGRVAKEFKRALRVFGLPTFYQRTVLAREICEQIQTRFEDAALSPVHQNTRLAEAYLARQTILDYDATALGAVDYLRVAKELEDELQPKQKASRRSRRAE